MSLPSCMATGVGGDQLRAYTRWLAAKCAHEQSPRNPLRVAGNFEMAKQAELIPQHKKAIFQKSGVPH